MMHNKNHWTKCVVDAYVDAFLQHLNSQQPSIRFTMEVEKDNTIPFLDTSVSSDWNGLLITAVYRKPSLWFTPSPVSETWYC